jgi:DNA-binding beta-propeller fold protein YncE
VGIAQSPNSDYVYVTNETRNGQLYVISRSRAENASTQADAVLSVAAVGAAPARVIVSADGSDVWVTDRDSNALVALSAAKLLKEPSQSLIARVTVGENPIGLAFVKDGKDIVVADANVAPGGEDTLALISIQKALRRQDQGALLGFIVAGLTPRELAVEPDGILLSTDQHSGQLQAIEAGNLP